MNFAEFKISEPGRSVFQQLGITRLLDVASSWGELRRLVVAHNDKGAGSFVRAVKEADGISSSGERVLLHAVCYSMDFAWLADELAEGGAWRRMANSSGDWRLAVAACILCQD